jgi:hypothetical protein
VPDEKCFPTRKPVEEAETRRKGSDEEFPVE